MRLFLDFIEHPTRSMFKVSVIFVDTNLSYLISCDQKCCLNLFSIKRLRVVIVFHIYFFVLAALVLNFLWRTWRSYWFVSYVSLLFCHSEEGVRFCLVLFGFLWDFSFQTGILLWNSLKFEAAKPFLIIFLVTSFIWFIMFCYF